MSEEIRIRVHGIPAPGGSKRAFVVTNKRTGQPFRNAAGRIIVNMTDDAGKRNKEWRKVVAHTAKNAFAQYPWQDPIEVEFHFFMPRPKSHFGTGRNAEILKSDAPSVHGMKPDLTKLIRSTEDALTGILWVDDAQICEQKARKHYALEPGVIIVMRRTLTAVQLSL